MKNTFGGVLLLVKLQISIILKSKLRNFHTCHQSSTKKEKTFGQLKCYLDTCLPRQTNKPVTSLLNKLNKLKSFLPDTWKTRSLMTLETPVTSFKGRSIFLSHTCFFWAWFWNQTLHAHVLSFICDVLCDLVSIVQFKKCEKHPWRSVTFSKVAGSKIMCNTYMWCVAQFGTICTI